MPCATVLLEDKMPRKLILVDLDHTISDAFHRDEMIGVTDWDTYHSRLIEDDPCHDFLDLLQSFNGLFKIVGLTSRPEKWRSLTMKWLAGHKVMLDDIWMRPNHDYRPAHEVKLSLCREKIGDDWKDRILFLIDDNEKVVAAFREEGVGCLQVFNKRGRK